MKVEKNFKILERFSLVKNEYYLIVGRLIPDNNSKIIIEGFLKSNSNKSIVIVGDVTYKDDYAKDVKLLKSKKVVFTGYINDQVDLTSLYNNCFGYVHGHEFGGTNPTMINALDLNCQILALDTIFNREMLEKKEAIFFKKNIKSITNSIMRFEREWIKLKQLNKTYVLPSKYNWDKITENYTELFYRINF